jgi:hypothetical protein
LIQTLKILLYVAGETGLDSTNMARERLEEKAQEKNCEAGRSFLGVSIFIFLVLQV